MATTDAKPGFRLPWSSDRSDPAPAGTSPEIAADGAPVDPDVTPQETETTDMIDAAPATIDHDVAVDARDFPGTNAPATPAPAAAPRRPNKFMADLTKAMQAAAETAREETLGRLAADAKAFIEEIHAASATEATGLRKKADDDVAAIREWSKAEIARIREETDERIAHRKDTLEKEIEEHAAAIEARIERVQARVDAFEAEMASFFERLLAEEDPTRFAAMAESLPEPPSLDSRTTTWGATTITTEPGDAPSTPDAGGPVAEATAGNDVSPWGPLPKIEADTTPTTEPSSESDADDPRLTLLGGSPDFAAAEAEAASFDAIDDGSESEPVPPLADDDIAARLASMVAPADATAQTTTTRVVVTGLVSVASIAAFKRHLSRSTGVHSVGVSSGPDGEFVFAVGHAADVALRDTVTVLPGFGARVTREADGELIVAAHDPESEG